MTDNGRTVYIVYNANGSIMGKLQYGYRKMTCPKDGEALCAACDITHGGLSLKETPAWVEVKKEMEASSNLKVVQLHKDELSPEVFICQILHGSWADYCAQLGAYIQDNKVALPVALLRTPGGGLEVIMDKSALSSCNGDARAFVEELRTKGLVERASL